MIRRIKFLSFWLLAAGWVCLWGFQGIPDGGSKEVWMGLYINQVKAGYQRFRTSSVFLEGKKHTMSRSESRISVSRLGGSPVNLTTLQESWYDSRGNPVKVRVKTRMSQEETVITAEVHPGHIVFEMQGETVKTVSVSEPVYFEVPLEKIIDSGQLKSGFHAVYPMVDPVAYTVSDCKVEVIGRENVRILGKTRRLWHIRSVMESLVKITADEWVDGRGRIFKSENRSGFIHTTALRMTKERALDMPEESLDIAFSSVIRPDGILKSPRSISWMKAELSGIPAQTAREWPEGESQRVTVHKDGSVSVSTASRIFSAEKSVTLPVGGREFQPYLQSTRFCQADDPEIIKTAEKILEGEKNAWKAAKKIALWIEEEITPSYDVGFASAREVLRNRLGDCSEHTVLFTALCRAAGLPARAAVGIMYGEDFFAYHMWPEVYAGEWIDLDPKWLGRDSETGELFTDATHIKFGFSGLDKDIFREMARAAAEVIGRLHIKIMDYGTRQ